MRPFAAPTPPYTPMARSHGRLPHLADSPSFGALSEVNDREKFLRASIGRALPTFGSQGFSPTSSNDYNTFRELRTPLTPLTPLSPMTPLASSARRSMPPGGSPLVRPPELPAFVPPATGRKATTRSELLDIRRQQKLSENAHWLNTMRTTLPQGRPLGAPGLRADAPPHLSYLDGSRGHSKWWGREAIHTQ